VKKQDDTLKDLEPLRVIPLSTVARLLGITVPTLLKNYGDKVVTISPRRRGLRVDDIRAIGEKAEKGA
jgi:hypothetical protein